MKSTIAMKYGAEIKKYCAENGLSFDKMRASPCCYDDEELIILHDEGDPEREKLGLTDNIPSPSTLEIYLENGSLRFVQTDITHKYLGVTDEDEAKERAAAKRASIREPALA
jgi:hypothetical protein